MATSSRTEAPTHSTRTQKELINRSVIAPFFMAVELTKTDKTYVDLDEDLPERRGRDQVWRQAAKLNPPPVRPTPENK